MKAKSELKLRFELAFWRAYRHVLGKYEPRHFALGQGAALLIPKPLSSGYHVAFSPMLTGYERSYAV